VRAFAAAHPDVEVEVIRTTWDDQVDVLHDGRVDVSIVRLPIDQAGLSLRPLFEEPRVAMVPSDHRLAAKPLIDVTDLADEDLLQDPDAVPEWRDIAVELRVGRPKPVPVYRSVEGKLEHVAAGRGVSILPLSVATYYQRPDVAVVPVNELATNKVSLAWIASRRSRLLYDFADLATTVEWTPQRAAVPEELPGPDQLSGAPGSGGESP
jgi:DNA-binding transcriptional LysR family regulator